MARPSYGRLTKRPMGVNPGSGEARIARREAQSTHSLVCDESVEPLGSEGAKHLAVVWGRPPSNTFDGGWVEEPGSGTLNRLMKNGVRSPDESGLPGV